MIKPSSAAQLIVRWSIPVGIFIASLLLVAVTLKDYGITWDEPPYFHATDLHIHWLSQFAHDLGRGQVQTSLSDEAIKADWHWDPYHVPHPPFSRIVSGLTKAAATPPLDKFTGYRLGPALFFAALATMTYLWMAEVFGLAAGLFSAFAIWATPDLFGFAHIAVTDLPLATMWFASAYCFWKGIRSWKWSIGFGIVWGLALATKFTAVLIPIPLLLWAQLYKRHFYGNNVFAMFFLSPLVMICTQPYLWHQPGLRILEFLYSGLSRGYRPDASFPVYWFGRLYSTHQLPWYYPFWMIGVTTPESILALALFGIVSLKLCPRRPVPMLLIINAVFVPLMGLLPGAVLHDGVRQLLSVFPFLAALAGGGFSTLVEVAASLAAQLKSLRRVERLGPKITTAAFVLAVLPPSLDVFLYHPYELSYYNRLTGGVRGAYEKGLEVTYFMDAFTPGFRRYLDATLPPNAVVDASFANFMFQYYQQENRLRRDLRFTNSEDAEYYILLSRRSAWSKKEWLLFNSRASIAAVRLGDVPLVSVYRLRGSLPRK